MKLLWAKLPKDEISLNIVLLAPAYKAGIWSAIPASVEITPPEKEKAEKTE